MKNRNFTNFNEFLNIRYIRSVKGIYMNPNDFDYMVERFKKISEENTKLKDMLTHLMQIANEEVYVTPKLINAARSASFLLREFNL